MDKTLIDLIKDIFRDENKLEEIDKKLVSLTVLPPALLEGELSAQAPALLEGELSAQAQVQLGGELSAQAQVQAQQQTEINYGLLLNNIKKPPQSPQQRRRIECQKLMCSNNIYNKKDFKMDEKGASRSWR